MSLPLLVFKNTTNGKDPQTLWSQLGGHTHDHDWGKTFSWTMWDRQKFLAALASGKTDWRCMPTLLMRKHFTLVIGAHRPRYGCTSKGFCYGWGIGA
jgi:hypothetical protein